MTSAGLDWAREKWKFGVGSKFIRQGEKNAVKYADEIIVLSKGVQKYFMDTYGRETHFIPNGVNRPEVREAKLIKDHFGLEKDSYILFLGRLVPEKGIRYLVEAFKNVKTDKKLVIAGGSSDTDSFMSLSHTARLTYVLLLDRMTLSQKNSWMDVRGRAYVLYKLKEFFSKNKKVFLWIGAGVACIVLFAAGFSSCTAMFSQAGSSVMATSYLSEDDAMLGAEAQYCDMEVELQDYLDKYEATHSYDEYHFDLDEIEHDPYVLVSILSALNEGQFTLDPPRDEGIPVYRQTASYALEADELDIYHASYVDIYTATHGAGCFRCVKRLPLRL